MRLVSEITIAKRTSPSEEASDEEDDDEEDISMRIEGPNDMLSYRNLYIDLKLRYHLFDQKQTGAGRLCFWYFWFNLLNLYL